MRAAAFAALALLALEAGAQTYKCQDDQRRITYSNMPCEKQGLKDAGPVAERLMTVPATVPPKAAPKKEPAKEPAKAPSGAGKDDAEVGRGATVKPVVPLMEKLAK